MNELDRKLIDRKYYYFLNDDLTLKENWQEFDDCFRDMYYGGYHSKAVILFPNFNIPFGKYKDLPLKEAIKKDDKYWVWFFKNIENKTSTIRNIKRFICLLAEDLSCSVNAEAGFLREYGNKFIKEFGTEYEEEN